MCATAHEDVDACLETIKLLESLAPTEVHSGHWPVRRGSEIVALAESREFVGTLDGSSRSGWNSPRPCASCASMSTCVSALSAEIR